MLVRAILRILFAHTLLWPINMGKIHSTPAPLVATAAGVIPIATTSSPAQSSTSDTGLPAGAPSSSVSWENGLPSVMIQIAWCESRDEPTAVNASSGDAGLFQDSLTTWQAFGGQGLPQYQSPEYQAEINLRIYQADGTEPWTASEACWG